MSGNRSGQPFANVRIRCASNPERDDVINVQAIGLERADESQRKVLVEQDFHEAWRTAGGR